MASIMKKKLVSMTTIIMMRIKMMAMMKSGGTGAVTPISPLPGFGHSSSAEQLEPEHSPARDGAAEASPMVVPDLAAAEAERKKKEEIQAEVDAVRKRLAGMTFAKPGSKKSLKAKWKVAAKVIVATKKIQKAGAASGMYRLPQVRTHTHAPERCSHAV